MPVALATKGSEPVYWQHEPFFGEVITAMVTPFKQDGNSVDYAVAEQLAAHLVENGSDSLVIGGTTGESPTLSWSEQYELFNVVKGIVGDKVKVIAGAGSNSTLEAVEATKRAAKMGLDGTLQVAPYYNKPPQDGLFEHFRDIALCEPDLPVMLYNIPGRCGVNMRAETTARLAQLDNVVAVKEASGNLEQFSQIRRATNSDFAMYSGDDSMTLPLLSLGGAGVVSVASHFIGLQLQSMIQAFKRGRIQDAADIHFKYFQLFNDLFLMTNPIPTKAALRLVGFPVGPVRLPLTDATPEVQSRLASLFETLELL